MPHAVLIPSLATTVEPVRLLVDDFLQTKHRLQSSIGSEPVEDGTQVTDHVTALPDKLELEGIVSDDTESGTSRPAEAFQALHQLQHDSEPFTVVTPWFTYDEMVIESMDSDQEGGGMVFELKLRRILRITLGAGGGRVAAQRYIPQDSPARNRPPPVNLGTVTPPDIGTFAADWDEELASAPQARAVSALIDRDLAAYNPPEPPARFGVQAALNRAGDLGRSRSLSGVAGRMVRGLDDDGAPGLSSLLGTEMSRYGLGDLPTALTSIGRRGERLGLAVSKAGDPRLARDIRLAKARQVFRFRSGLF